MTKIEKLAKRFANAYPEEVKEVAYKYFMAYANDDLVATVRGLFNDKDWVEIGKSILKHSSTAKNRYERFIGELNAYLEIIAEGKRKVAFPEYSIRDFRNTYTFTILTRARLLALKDLENVDVDTFLSYQHADFDNWKDLQRFAKKKGITLKKVNITKLTNDIKNDVEIIAKDRAIKLSDSDWVNLDQYISGIANYLQAKS